MAKSKIARQSNAVKRVRNSQNVVPLNLTIPYKEVKSNQPKSFDVSHLLHLECDKKKQKISSRTEFIRRFCKKANQYVSNGNSAATVKVAYDSLRSYIAFCDAVDVDPFTESGYLKFAGNDGELRHRIKMYHPSKRLWEYNHGDEIGIKEASAGNQLSAFRSALDWCALPVADWARHHRGFTGQSTPFVGYSEPEEKLLVARLSNVFYALATQLIAAKENNTPLPATLPIVIALGEHEEVVQIPTSLDIKAGGSKKDGTAVNHAAAFNLTMGAAYHLMCFFTSLNDSNVRSISHPVKVHIEERDKTLETVRVSSYKPRANKEVDALLLGETFDVDKRDGVKFIKLLERLSKLYGNTKDGDPLLFTLNNAANVSDSFNLREINKKLVNQLHLLSPNRAGNLPWFKTLFYGYRNQQAITLKKTVNHLGRTVVHKKVEAIAKTGAVQGATNSAYCILSCYTDLPLKNILLPLTYSEKDSDGYITVSFNYRNGLHGCFNVPASDLALIKDIEHYANENADKHPKKYERLLLTRSSRGVPHDWEGISPISGQLMGTWSVEPNHYYLSLQSSRWREMTSNQVYADGGIQAAQSLLGNTLETLDRNYLNGDPRLNNVITSQGIEVLQNINDETNVEQAKAIVAKRRGIPILSHDEAKKMREESIKTNPNGLVCNGQQVIDGKNTQRATNHALGLNLPCTEFDMCHKCQSAKAVNETEAIYKLISLIDALKDTLNMYPDAKSEAHEKIEQFELTLDGASDTVFEEAMSKFNTQGRHPRVSIDHAILTLGRLK
ncbi:hypothetical protein SKA34_20927 [Photobacterium sp. SKA34]|uniref:hypothetical protein n=1 Tax=Photobacterium sp. SKA34 TaxID=121723 RepID=UPI00006BEB86|nr:hypothetical protein [Photobacterium sp. SKA34]EAR54787.1 hypothetical protein SKA34_20927 [Photobacterium sp. SKA34]